MSTIADSGKRTQGEHAVLELTEESREQQWDKPSFLAELFMGKYRRDLISPYPVQSDEDKKLGDDYMAKVGQFLKDNLDPEAVDRTGSIPEKVYQGLAELGALGLKIPKEYGGMGFSQTNYNRIVGFIGTYCASTAVFLSAHQSIGLPQPLKLFGTDEQKKKWLTLISKGAKSAFALTEVAVGSDPAKMSTTAVPTEDGKHYIINGEKLWCTNGLIADVLVVMAQTPAIKRPDGREKKQITAFIVDAHSEGVQKIHRCDFMGIRGIQNGVIRFKDVKVPAENIIWGLGKGLRLALTTLNTGRLTIPGAATAASKFCLQVVREWGKERVQWGRPIGEHEASADLMSKVAASSYAIEAITYLTSGWVDNNQFDVRLEAAFAKIFTTEVCWRVIDSTLQLRGGRGYETSESLRGRGEKGYPLERMMRDFRINTIIEGTTTILKLFVAREAFDKHLSIAGALFTKAPVTEKLKTLFIKIPAFYLLWYPKQWLSLPDFLCPEFYQGWTGKQHLFIKKYSKKLARTIFHAMLIYGPNLDKRQMTIMRLMNAGMFLFGAAAVLTRFETHKKQGSLQTGEELLAKYAATGLSNRTTEMFERLKLRRRDSKSVKMSKAIMKGDYEWMETGVLLGKL